ncbi:MAG TPA: DPP IV N-terminal domain-containing protein [Gemmatimonadales bacterium]|jgi:dipeptidyl aminopeptidase/acylaminoacyl peptidase|nr:DPP IV N-terminal domain-containing protein [Gemmatimonadales bacterium]
MRTLTVALLLAVAAPPAAAQQRPQLTAADYARAEKFMGYNTAPLVFGMALRPTWLPDGRFWYRNSIPGGTALMLVDPLQRTRGRAFDQAKLAAALAAAAGTPYDSLRLPFSDFEFSADKQSISFELAGRRWTCGVIGDRCSGVAAARSPGGRNSVLSPDGKRAAFIRGENLWVREEPSGTETQLTSDGVKDFGYATDNAGWIRSDRPVLLWSPDSRKIATFQQDERAVGEMYVVETRVGHPSLQAWKYPLPGDSVIQMIHRVVLDLSGATPRVVRLQLPPDPHRSTTCDHVSCDGVFADVEWSPDASRLVFVSTSRDHKRADVRIADAETGAVRDLFSETVPTFFESGFASRNWRVLWETQELLWYSQRSDWGHLYLYDLQTGRLKAQLTSGAWNVLTLTRVDEKGRTLFFTGVGREPGRDPYFRHFYRIGLDGKHLTLLTPEDADHDITLAPDGRFFTDSYSRPELPPTSVLREARGKLVLALERADISRLVATGWTPPLPFSVKARDGRTDLYGLLYRPSNFDSTRKYPIINYIYPGPQTGSVGSRSFSPTRSDHRALAELGFVVVQLDGMGTPLRSKSFHAAYYGNMGDNTLPDQVAGMQQLAARYPWIDLDRTGIWGHSGGGYAAADAILRYPDFFKVAISEAGNHDQREYEDDWGEKWQGLLTRGAGGDSYDNQANQNLARNLKGKLLIVHGTLDTNVPPYNTLLVVNELVKANKDFDLLLLPNRGHGFGGEPYMIRRRWDYFVRNLLGAEPPANYQLRSPAPVAP